MMAYYATMVKDVLNNLKNKMLENVKKLTRTIDLAIRLSNVKDNPPENARPEQPIDFDYRTTFERPKTAGHFPVGFIRMLGDRRFSGLPAIIIETLPKIFYFARRDIHILHHRT